MTSFAATSNKAVWEIRLKSHITVSLKNKTGIYLIIWGVVQNKMKGNSHCSGGNKEEKEWPEKQV